MALEMKKDSRWWYARFYIDGKAKVFNLEIPIEGDRPASLKKGPFDPAFIQSRGRAQEKHDHLKAEVVRPKQPEEYVQRLHELRTGRRIESIPLANMADEWVALPRKRNVSENYVNTGRTRIDRFVKFVTGTYEKVTSMADVTPEIARAFMKHEEATGITGRTYNGVLGLMKSTFHHLSHKANILHNPFDGIPTKEMETVHRRPFNQGELEAILEAADKDAFLRPVVITGVFTAMRLGDCCCLRWDAVDLANGFVTVKTSKTGETTDIPMFPILRRMLSATKRGKSPFVFPEQAKMYQTNRSGVSYRMRRLFEDAGFFDRKEDEDGEVEAPKEVAAGVVPSEAELARALKALEGVSEDEMPADKRDRVVETLRVFGSGKTVSETAGDLGFGKSTVSGYLRDVEKLTGLKLRKARKQKKPASEHLGDVHITRETGQKRATVRDFHSFRVTWITLALAAGVPLELVQRVTGHRTTDVVLKHYFRPGRDAFKQAIEGAMPKMLMAGEIEDVEDLTPDELLENALAVLQGVTGRATKKAAEASALISRAKDAIAREPEVVQAEAV